MSLVEDVRELIDRALQSAPGTIPAVMGDRDWFLPLTLDERFEQLLLAQVGLLNGLMRVAQAVDEMSPK